MKNAYVQLQAAISSPVTIHINLYLHQQGVKPYFSSQTVKPVTADEPQPANPGQVDMVNSGFKADHMILRRPQAGFGHRGKDQNIRVVAADERIRAKTADQHIAVRLTAQNAVTCPPDQPVAPLPAKQPVVAVTARQSVHTQTALHLILPRRAYSASLPSPPLNQP